MIGLLQRVSSAAVSINNHKVASIGTGLLLFIGIEKNEEYFQFASTRIKKAQEILEPYIPVNDGDYDGFTIYETDQITKVVWGDREHQAISHLISRTESVTTPKFESKIFQDIIIELGTKSESVCFYEENSEEKYDIGKIVKYDDDWLKIHTYAIKNSLSRMYKLLLRETISRIAIDSPYQNKIVDLHTTGL